MNSRGEAGEMSKEDDGLAPVETTANMSRTPLISIVTMPSHQLAPEQLGSLVDPKSTVEYEKLGGVLGIAKALGVDVKRGVCGAELEQVLREKYGANILPHAAPPTLLQFLWDAYKDKILILLSFAALVSLGIGIYSDIKEGTASHWIEGAAIMVAVVLVVLVNAVNDFQKDRQFRKLSARNEDRQVRVLRNGAKSQISVYDLVVGDVVLLDPGVPLHTPPCFDRVLAGRAASRRRADRGPRGVLRRVGGHG